MWVKEKIGINVDIFLISKDMKKIIRTIYVYHRYWSEVCCESHILQHCCVTFLRGRDKCFIGFQANDRHFIFLFLLGDMRNVLQSCLSSDVKIYKYLCDPVFPKHLFTKKEKCDILPVFFQKFLSLFFLVNKRYTSSPDCGQ